MSKYIPKSVRSTDELNLYVCWFFDESKCLSVHLNEKTYKFHRSSNGLPLGEKLIKVIHHLIDCDVVYSSRDEDGKEGHVWSMGYEESNRTKNNKESG